MLMDIIRETEIPPYLIIPTHVNRDAALSNRRWSWRRWAPSSTSPPASRREYGFEGTIKPSEAVVRCLENGVKIQNVTMSSDANGSMAVYDEEGRFAGLCVTTVETMHKVFRELARDEGRDAGDGAASGNVESRGRDRHVSAKSCVAEGADADLIIMG